MKPFAPNYHRSLALLWFAVVAAVAWHQVLFWRAPDFVTDVVELLPRESDPVLERATGLLVEAATRQWVVLIGASDWEVSKKAAGKALSILDPLRLKLQDDGAGLSRELMDLMAAHRGMLVTPASRAWLQSATQGDIAQRAMQNLIQPVSDGVSSWRDDPLGLLGEWARARAQWSRLRPRDGWLWVEEAGTQWVVLPFVEPESGLSTWNAGNNTQLLASMRAGVLAGNDADIRVIAAGTTLLAEAAAERARFEVSVIGTGSLVAVVLLTLVSFGSIRPIVLVTLSLAVGCAVALSVTELVFGRVHLLTAVFGASLVGVAEDYGIHYFAAQQGAQLDERWQRLRQIAPGLWLALATSGIAYLALGIAPFPGLRQIAVFSCVGLLAAFLTVLCWFPWLDRKPLRYTSFATWFSRSLDSWPRWPAGRRGWLLAVLGIAALIVGILRLEVVDDVRLLQNVPPRLLAEQVEVGRILGLASPAQVYLVSGDSQESMLRNEEALTMRLAQLVDDRRMAGYLALSDWVPSEKTQRESIALVERANSVAWLSLARMTGEKIGFKPESAGYLTVEQFQRTSRGVLSVPFWRDETGEYHTLVLLKGVTRDLLGDLERAAAGLSGVRWIDSTAGYSRILAWYRIRLGALLLVGVVAVILLLHWRYGASAWRAYLPTVIGGFITLACFGWMNVPLQLFVVLSLILLLGMGIDYGIFMLEHPGERSVWLAVAIAGISTLLAFGLLALSTTPALHAFGLGMLIGESSIWLLTPIFRPANWAEAGHS